MSRYDPPQCQICADYWLKEGRPMGHYLIVSRGGHIPGVHQPASGGKAVEGRESGSSTKNPEKSAGKDEKNAGKNTAHQGEKSGKTASSR